MPFRSNRLASFVSVLSIPIALSACGGKGTTTGSGGTSSATNGTGTGSPTTGTGTGTTRNERMSTGTGGSMPVTGTQIKDFTGVNANIADPVDNLTPLGWVREYHNWGWICDNYASGPAYPGMLYTFMNFNGWDWDMYFQGMQAAGVEAFPAVQGGVPWIQNGAIPPIAGGADKTKAASYIAHGDTMYQLAARYGAVQVPDANLKLKANQTRVSGLGTVHYYEDFNEQDNAAGFTGDAFAAMASADYDGDQKRQSATPSGSRTQIPMRKRPRHGWSLGEVSDDAGWVAIDHHVLGRDAHVVEREPGRQLPRRRHQRASL